MALAEDVIAFVNELSSAGRADAVIGSTNAPSQESSEPHISSSPNRDEDIESESADEKKKHTYSVMSEEVCPTRDREIFQKKLTKKYDVRYLNEVKTFKDKFKASCYISCNQQQCPVMQERLNQHQHDFHHDYRTPQNPCDRKIIRDQGVNVSPTLSRMRLPKFNVPQIDEVQTDISMRDFSPIRIYPPPQATIILNDIINKEVPLRKSETRNVLPKRNFYKEHLQNIILNWLQNVPMFYTLNFTTSDIKENIVNNLAEKINRLSAGAFDKHYELKTKMEIENCLCRLPMWLPGTRQEQAAFKDGLREKLWRKIQELNRNFLGINYNKIVECEMDNHSHSSSLSLIDESYEREVVEWSQKLQLNEDQTCLTRRQVVTLIMKRLTPLLRIPLHTTSYKLILKGEIIDILDDLPLNLSSTKYKTVHLNRFAEELANRLLGIQIKLESSQYKLGRKNTTIIHHCVNGALGVPTSRPKNFKKAILEKVTEILNRIQVCHRQDLKTEICSIFIDTQGNVRTENEMGIQSEIFQLLRNTGKLAEERTLPIAKMIIRHVKTAIKDFKSTTTTSFDSVIPEMSGTVSISRWGDKQPTSSTPTKVSKKEIPKFNDDEKFYMKNVTDLIRGWMDILPKQYNENRPLKESIINDLASDIIDQLKVEQLAPETRTDKDKYLSYIMYRWLYKIEFFDDEIVCNDVKPYVADFLVKLKDIKVPNLTVPQHGTQQATGNIVHMQGEHGWEEDFLLKGIDVLEDPILEWLNEQPSEFFAYNDKEREKHVHDLALTVQDRLRNKNPESDIDQDINQWLKKIVKLKEIENIGFLTQGLKERIITVPQDQSLESRFEVKKRYRVKRAAAKQQNGAEPNLVIQDIRNFGNAEGDPDKTIKVFVAKFIEHNYDIEDPMAKRAFSRLLNIELRKLSPQIRKEVYDNFEKSTTHEHFSPDLLRNELGYIKIISDWLNHIPIDPSYNTVGNKNRIDFVNDLARNVQEVKEQKAQNPQAFDYDYYIASMIVQNMHSYGLPILPEYKSNTPIMVDQLLKKLLTPQRMMCSYKYGTQPLSRGAESLTTRDNKKQDLNEFVANYVSINGRDIDDEVKLEAWTARLQQELKKLSHESQDPNKLCKADVYGKLSKVPIPTSESVKRFGLQNDYMKEISDWLKNFPLKSIGNDPKAEEERIIMVCELAQEIAERDALKNSDLNDNKASNELVEFTTKWISRLPLDPCKKINDVSVVIQQLMNRIEKVNRERESRERKQDPSLDVVLIKESISCKCEICKTASNASDSNKNKINNTQMPKSTNSEGDNIQCIETMEITTNTLGKNIECDCESSEDLTIITETTDVENIECDCKSPEELTAITGNADGEIIINKSGRESPEKTMAKTAKTDDENIECESTDESKVKTADSEGRLKCGCKSPKKSMAQTSNLGGWDEGDNSECGCTSPNCKESQESNANIEKKSPLSPRCKKDKVKRKPGSIIVESIEGWSNKLPIKSNSTEEEKAMKEGIARKLYQKVGELNVDPKTFNDDLLYRDMLGDAIDTQLENVPQNPELRKKKEKLKEGLLKTILDTKKIIREKSAGDNYKHKLEATIDASIPNPVQSRQVLDPGFEIYKNHLADMFILENFDHANDDDKAKYEQRVRFEIDKYFEGAQNKNALPLTKDQMYNELYGVLFKVPMPSENSVVNEVEQIKTRCEIDAWFEDLPLKEADGFSELLEWDKILSTLTKKIHEIEKNESHPEVKLHKEIMKWLEKLPLLPKHKGLDYYVHELQNILSSTTEARKYVAAEPLDKIVAKRKGNKSKKSKDKKSKKDEDDKEKKDKKDKGNTSQLAGHNSNIQTWLIQKPTMLSKATYVKPCVVSPRTTKKKPGDIIVEVVEEWCNQLPLISKEDNNKIIRDNISTRIIVHISKLNMDAEIFNDDFVYDELLDEELENVLNNLPVPCDFDQSKDTRKYQLKEQIKSLKPLLKEEKARHEYKEELISTVISIIKEPLDANAEKTASFYNLIDEIVENFVQYNYYRNDEKGRRIYKNNVHNAVVNYFTDIRDKDTDEKVHPLVRRNQLLCELAKIPIPKQALQEEVEEIKMRNEVQQLFTELDIPDGETENKLKKNLSKRLHNLEKSGHRCEIEMKMKTDISRCLKKLNVDASPDVVENFVRKLKFNEAKRKTPPMSPSQAEALNNLLLPGSSKSTDLGNPGNSHQDDSYDSQGYETYVQVYNQKGTYYNQVMSQPVEEDEEQWYSLPTDSPQTVYGNFEMPYDKLGVPEYDAPSQYDTLGTIISETVSGAFDKFRTKMEHVCKKFKNEKEYGRQYRPKDEFRDPYATNPQTEKKKNQTVNKIKDQNVDQSVKQTGNKQFNKFTLDLVDESKYQTVNSITDLVVDYNMDTIDRDVNHTISRPYDKQYRPKEEAKSLYAPDVADKNKTYKADSEVKNRFVSDVLDRSEDLTVGSRFDIVIKKINQSVERCINQNKTTDNQHSSKYRLDDKASKPHGLERGVSKRLDPDVESSMNQNIVTENQYDCGYSNDADPGSPDSLEIAVNKLNQFIEKSNQNIPATPHTHYRHAVEATRSNSSNRVFVDRGINHNAISYNDLAGRKIISSPIAPKSHSAPEGKILLNHFQKGSLCSSQSTQKSKRQNNNPAGPIPKLGYIQIATPRQVAQGPHLMANTHHDVSVPLDITPDTLFSSSFFKSTPLHQRMIVPVIQPIPRSSILSMRPSGRLLANSDRALVPSSRSLRIPLPMTECNLESSDEEELCLCERCSHRPYKGIPVCMVALQEYFDDCVGYSPMWYRLHYPEFYYY